MRYRVISHVRLMAFFVALMQRALYGTMFHRIIAIIQSSKVKEGWLNEKNKVLALEMFSHEADQM